MLICQPGLVGHWIVTCLRDGVRVARRHHEAVAMLTKKAVAVGTLHAIGSSPINVIVFPRVRVLPMAI